MAKRFSDSSKFRDPWYRKLSPKMKCAWEFMLAECDQAGFWKIDLESMTFFIGEAVSQKEFDEAFSDRIQVVSDNEVWITKFIDFQYGALSEACKPHIPVIKKLIDRNIDVNQRVSKGYPKGINTLEEKDKDKEKVKEKKGGMQGGKSNFDLEAAYQAYPRKLGKSEGMKRLTREIKTESDFQSLKLAIHNYKTHCETENLEAKFIKHFSSFVSAWRDWLDPNHGISEDFAKPKLIQTEEEMNEYLRTRGMAR